MSAIAAPFRSFGSWYLCKAQKYPFATAFWTSGIKTSAADIFAQKARGDLALALMLLICRQMFQLESGRRWRQCRYFPVLQVVERNEEFDWTRHLMMTGFGFVYLGSFQYLLYNKLYACCLAKVLLQATPCTSSPK